MLWGVPVGVAVVLALPVVLALRRVSLEARSLQRSVAALVELRGAVQELRDEARAVSGRMPELRARARPTATSAP